jgi:hypothetical protein
MIECDYTIGRASKMEFSISSIVRGLKNFSALNDGRLPSAYYAMAEQRGAGFWPDVLTLQRSVDSLEDE